MNPFNAKIEVHLKENKNYRGIVNISTSIPLTIESMVVEISFIAVGAMAPIRKTLVTIDVLSYAKSLSIGIQEFPFDFNLENDTLPAYHGKNVSMSHECTAKIYFDDDNYRKLDLSVFKNLLTYVKKTNQIKITNQFNYYNIKSAYEAVNKNYDMAFLNPTVLIIAALVYVPSYLYLLYRLDSFSFVSVLFGLLFGGIVFVASVYGIYYVLSSNNVKAHISPYKNQFQCKISELRLVKNPKIHYRIIEKVVDQRGTSSSTYKHTVYTSPTKTLPNSKTVLFDYPSNQNLATIHFKNVELYWEIVIKGAKNSLYAKFEVKTV